MFAPVADLLPRAPARVLDIGAGTGRDAAWFAAQGHRVTAVEPVDALREAGVALHAGAGVRFLADALPDAPHVRALGETFDLITLIGVWQHVAPKDRAATIATLAGLMARDGLLVMSLRHGIASPNRPVFAAPPDEAIAFGAVSGITLIHREDAESVQAVNRANGVTWTWLAFRRNGAGAVDG